MASALVTACVLPILAQNAHATFPGSNGKLAFTRTNSSSTSLSDIFTINSDGSVLTQLTSGLRARYPSWSPDGSKIAFQVTNSDGSVDEIYVMNADGSGQTKLVSLPESLGAPVWYPDGLRVGFMSYSSSTSYAINIDGTGGLVAEAGGPTYDSSLAPDGSLRLVNISVCAGGQISSSPAYGRSGQACDSHTGTTNPDGSGLIQLTMDQDQSSGPVWSSDSTKVAFQSLQRNVSDSRKLEVMNRDGSGRSALTVSTYDTDLSWQPVITTSTTTDGGSDSTATSTDSTTQTTATPQTASQSTKPAVKLVLPQCKKGLLKTKCKKLRARRSQWRKLRAKVTPNTGNTVQFNAVLRKGKRCFGLAGKQKIKLKKMRCGRARARWIGAKTSKSTSSTHYLKLKKRIPKKLRGYRMTVQVRAFPTGVDSATTATLTATAKRTFKLR